MSRRCIWSVLANQVEEFFESLGGRLRRGADDQRSAGHQRNRSEVSDHVVGNGLVQERRHHMDRRGQHQRVAIRCGLGDIVRADDAAGATGAVLDDKTLPERLVQLLREKARDAVDGSPGGIGYHDGHHAARIGVGLNRRGGKPKQGRAQQSKDMKSCHRGSSQTLLKKMPRVASPVEYVLAGDEPGMV